MELVRQFRMKPEMANNLLTNLDRLCGLADIVTRVTRQTTTPLDEDNAKAAIDDMLNTTKSMEACFTQLYSSLNACSQVLTPPVVQVEEAIKHKHLINGVDYTGHSLMPRQVEQDPRRVSVQEVTIKQFLATKTEPFVTARQFGDRLVRKKSTIKAVRRIGHHENVYNYAELNKVYTEWQQEGYRHSKAVRAKKPKIYPELFKGHKPMMTLSDFVDTFQLDGQNAHKLRHFLQQAYYDKAITTRDLAGSGTGKFYTYPVGQMEVAARRWAIHNFGNKNVLVKKNA